MEVQDPVLGMNFMWLTDALIEEVNSFIDVTPVTTMSATASIRSSAKVLGKMMGTHLQVENVLQDQMRKISRKILNLQPQSDIFPILLLDLLGDLKKVNRLISSNRFFNFFARAEKRANSGVFEVEKVMNSIDNMLAQFPNFQIFELKNEIPWSNEVTPAEIRQKIHEWDTIVVPAFDTWIAHMGFFWRSFNELIIGDCLFLVNKLAWDTTIEKADLFSPDNIWGKREFLWAPLYEKVLFWRKSSTFSVVDPPAHERWYLLYTHSSLDVAKLPFEIVRPGFWGRDARASPRNFENSPSGSV